MSPKSFVNLTPASASRDGDNREKEAIALRAIDARALQNRVSGKTHLR